MRLRLRLLAVFTTPLVYSWIITRCNLCFLHKQHLTKPYRSGYDADFSSAEFERREGLILRCKLSILFKRSLNMLFKIAICKALPFEEGLVVHFIYQHLFIPPHNFLFLNLKNRSRFGLFSRIKPTTESSSRKYRGTSNDCCWCRLG